MQRCAEPSPALSRSCDGAPAPSLRTLALAGAASALALLLDQPAQAHGIAHGGIAAGFLHPLGGADHLLLLLGVGAAASCISSQLLLWALAGAIGGGVFGALGGTLPAQEFLAAFAITAVAVLVSGGTFVLLRRLPLAWTRGVCLLLR